MYYTWQWNLFLKVILHLSGYKQVIWDLLLVSGLITVLFKMKKGRSEWVEIGIFSQILGIFGIYKVQDGNRTQ